RSRTSTSRNSRAVNLSCPTTCRSTSRNPGSTCSQAPKCLFSPQIVSAPSARDAHPGNVGGMSHNTTLGRVGEQRAADYLRDRGYDVIDRNWRCSIGEIDLVVTRGDDEVDLA